MVYIFDETLEGLLTAVFEWFERKPKVVVLKTHQTYQPAIFENSLIIINNREKADRVWIGLKQKLDQIWMRKVYCAYLSDCAENYNFLFHFICYLFSNQAGAEKDYGNTYVLAVSQIAKKVEREKHRMEAFIRFQLLADSIFYCSIDPDFNVLPLIVNHFKNRYADQKWMIYDLKRKYGLYYNLQKVEEISLSAPLKSIITPTVQVLNDQEALYANLWKDYFKSTNIESRKNTKLHVQHVPKRYWKYLTEKQLF